MKTKLSKRITALLLVLIMMLSMLPLSVLAATVGEIVIKDGIRGETGVKNDTLGDKGSISWPIKIYDYLSDGMLFEFTQYDSKNTDYLVSSRSDFSSGGGQYVLGKPVPYTPLAIDYTTDFAYQNLKTSSYFYRFITTTTVPADAANYSNTAVTNEEGYKLEIVEAEDYVSPQHLRYTRGANHTADNTQERTNACLVDFSKLYNTYVELSGDYQQYYNTHKALYQPHGSFGNEHWLKKDSAKYMTIVYRSEGLESATNLNPIEVTVNAQTTTANATMIHSSNIASAVVAGKNQSIDADGKPTYTDATTFDDTDGDWRYVVVDLNKAFEGNADWNATKTLHSVYVYLGMDGAETDEYFDLRQTGYFTTLDEAKKYGDSCMIFNLEPGEFLEDRDGNPYWYGATNNAYGLRFPSIGYGLPRYHKGGKPQNNNSGKYAGYYSFHAGWEDPDYFINRSKSNGEWVYECDTSYNANRKSGRDANGRFNGDGPEFGENGVYYIDDEWNIKVKNAAPGTEAEQIAAFGKVSKANGKYLDTDQYDFGGYKLFSRFTKGQLTMGLLESTLIDDGNGNKIPEYKPYTVEYIADLLSKTLVIPRESPDDGPFGGKRYNYTYVAGVKNGAQYGYTNGVANDLAQALRNCLNITSEYDNATNRLKCEDANGAYKAAPEMGLYAETIKKDLIGPFNECSKNITTCMDAAYYLLHNLYIPNSYNQAQDDYRTITLSSAVVEDEDSEFSGKEAYVFDGGFTTGDVNELVSGKLTQDEYKATSANGVIYDQANKTIRLDNDNIKGKDYYFYSKNESEHTTRFPFLPVLDTDESNTISDTINYPAYKNNQTNSYNFADNAKRSYDVGLASYEERNYNFALVSNAEFVYHKDDDLFFEFEGDDDVYLFINGELVLDLGSAHRVSNCSLNVNKYVDWAEKVLKAEYENPDQTEYSADDLARAEKLYLEEGEIADFDFYYMERHGYGSNMRIVTNMEITDPDMRVNKTAYQFGEEVEYGGLVDPDTPIEYNFNLKNTGNEKLFHLTFRDENIGVTLDENGLSFDNEEDNGVFIMNSKGGPLEATDLTAVVRGYREARGSEKGNYNRNNQTAEYELVAEGTGEYVYTEVPIEFKDEEELKNFLATLAGEGLESGREEEELAREGAGLWVDADVTIKGIYYLLKDDNIKSGKFENTVYATADPDYESTGRTLRGQSTHRVYIAGIPYYYQWAGHNLYVSKDEILQDAITASKQAGNNLNEYESFFKNHTTVGSLKFILCDKDGNAITDTKYPVKEFIESGKNGYLVSYENSGVNGFDLLMIDSTAAATTTDISKLQKDKYAIMRVMIYSTQVNDSTYVLDYGLQTEELDKNGELFKNDDLLGYQDRTVAKVMGFSTTKPSYLDPAKNATSYNRIDFTKNTQKEIKAEDGIFKLNMDIHDTDGHPIAYSSATGRYTLTDPQNVTVTVTVPADWGIPQDTEPFYEQSDTISIYAWYDNGTNIASWPGTAMEKVRPGTFTAQIPGDIQNIIINRIVVDTSNNTTQKQTSDIKLNTGEDVWVNMNEDTNGNITYDVSYQSSNTTVYVSKLADTTNWNKYHVYAMDANGKESAPWPGTQIESEVDADGYLTVDLPGNVTKVVVNNGGGKTTAHQTEELNVYTGKETWIDIGPKTTPGVGDDGQKNVYTAVTKMSIKTKTITANVPTSWESPCVSYKDLNAAGGNQIVNMDKITEGEDNGCYSCLIPAGVNEIIISNDHEQTGTIQLPAGLDTKITLDSQEPYATVKATVPANYGNVYFYFYNEYSGTPVAGSWPGTKVDKTGDKYTLKAPYGATSVIINNGAGTQTQDLMLKFGTETEPATNEIEVTSGGAAKLSNKLVVTMNDNNWGNVYIAYKAQNSDSGYTYEQLTKSGDKYTFNLTGKTVSAYRITNGSDNNITKQTGEFKKLYIGNDTNMTVNSTSDVTINSVVETEGYSITMEYGEEEVEGIFFKPTNFMDNKYSLYMGVTVHEKDDANDNTWNGTPTAYGGININREVQMYKKITVLPANVVYYEDDFEGVKYENTANTISTIGNGSGKLQQTVKQDQEYGKDTTYENPNRNDSSGDGYKEVTVKDTSKFASFNFTGTGFEIIGRTKAVDSGTLMVSVKDSSDTVIKKRIVITEYNNSADNGDGKDESITQVPIVRIDGLDYGNYTVELSGIPIYDRTQNKDANGKYPVKDSYIIIDGIRIFQPLTDKDEDYKDEEDGATFSEIRTLIMGKDDKQQAFALSYNDDDGLKLSGGLKTWTENRNEYKPSEKLDDLSEEQLAKVKWSGNTVDSLNDYLLAGPNNEVYMVEESDDHKTALTFYVQENDKVKNEDGKPVHDIQIAAKALDYGNYYGNASTGLNARLQYASRTDKGYVWKDLVTIKSGTEQYYTIPYKDCIYDTNKDAYLVIIKIADTDISGMASYTSLKYNGVDLLSLNFAELDEIIHTDTEGDVSTGDGGFVTPDFDTFKTISSTMASNEVKTYDGDGLMFTVTFQNANGEVYKTQVVKYGEDAKAPANPTKVADEFYTYTFAGWDIDYRDVVCDLVVTAEFDAIAIDQEKAAYEEYKGYDVNSSSNNGSNSAKAQDVYNQSFSTGFGTNKK